MFRAQVLGHAGRTVTVEASDSHALDKLSARWAPDDDGTFKRLVIERTPQGRFASRVETAPLVAATRLGSGTVRTSLFAAADEARIPDGVVGKIVEIFSSDIDFHRALQRGDRFNVVYEALEADGEADAHAAASSRPSSSTRASCTRPCGSRSRAARAATTRWTARAWTPRTWPRRWSSRASPAASRCASIRSCTSWKAHLGVDYGAPTGTPVRTVGDGVVEFAGEQNGFGNVVIVKHNNTDQTFYAHLSRIDVRPGQSVQQGQNIGAVGSTGWATGPHLHFEFRVNGVHHDPMEMAKPAKRNRCSARSPARVRRMARSMRAQLAAASTAVLASAD